MPTSTRTLSLAALLAAAASGHVVLENPKPFPFIDYGPTNPVAADGQDFPCKVPPGTQLDTSAPATVMAVGEDQTLSFQGRAVHGGGSCQLALTRDAQPTKQSEWMVIHSIEGGCPARHQKGNLEGPNTDRYTFRIPAAIAPGDYVFSWTWNARIGGQPEFYQNCAPITVTAPPTKKRQRLTDRRAVALARRADFPPLFMANMGAAAGGCTTQDALTQQQAIAYPNPGASVDRPEGDAALFPQPCDGNPRAGTGVKPPTEQPGGGDGDAPASSSLSSSSTAPAPTPSATATTTTAAAVSSTSAEGPATTTSAATSTPAASSTPATSAAPPAETTTTTESPTSPAVPVPSGGAGGDDGPSASCTHGQLACFDGGKTAWSCTGNAWVKIADAPAGMQCTPGVGQGENLVWKPE